MYIFCKAKKIISFTLAIPTILGDVFKSIIRDYRLQLRVELPSFLSTMKLILIDKMQKEERSFLRQDGANNT